MEWEALKENYVPLKAGRKPEALKEAADPADLARKKELDEKRRCGAGSERQGDASRWRAPTAR